MDTQSSDIFDLVGCFEEAARHGDWKRARETAALLTHQALPAGHEELGGYLRRLKEALIVAKVSRAHMAATLARVNSASARLNAAAGFNNMRVNSVPPRQEFGEAADS